MRIEQWLPFHTHPFSADFVLCGYVFGNPKFIDGTLITTSRVVELDLSEGYAITKSGSRYELGSRLIGSHYESEFMPNE